MLNRPILGLAKLAGSVTLCFLAMVVVCGTITSVAVRPALADDGDGGGGGAGAGGGGGDAGWNPFAQPGYKKRYRRYYRKSRKRYYRAQQIRSERSRARPREIVALGLTDTSIAALTSLGYALTGDRSSSLLGGRITRLRIPSRRGYRSAIDQARSIAGDALVVRNHLYSRPPSRRYRTSGQPCGRSCEEFQLTAWTDKIGRCTADAVIGVIDTAVDTTHPSLTSARIENLVARRNDRPAADAAHGTAVASLLAGSAAGGVAGVAPGARLFVIDAFHRAGKSEQADTFDLIVALGMLQERRIPLVNMSLTGPENPLLEKAILKTIEAGTVIVAAVGRPGSKLGYPARYRGVIAVTAVDRRLRPSRLAARGEHVAFAAPGVGVSVAGLRGTVRAATGSSFAAPFVTAAYAAGINRRRSAEQITGDLNGSARDLGKPGRDPIFGWGLVQYGAITGGC